MKEIVIRLQEKRNIEVAKSILEDAGYEVSTGKYPTMDQIDAVSDHAKKCIFEFLGESDKSKIYVVNRSQKVAYRQINKLLELNRIKVTKNDFPAFVGVGVWGAEYNGTPLVITSEFGDDRAYYFLDDSILDNTPKRFKREKDELSGTIYDKSTYRNMLLDLYKAGKTIIEGEGGNAESALSAVASDIRRLGAEREEAFNKEKNIFPEVLKMIKSIKKSNPEEYKSVDIRKISNISFNYYHMYDRPNDDLYAMTQANPELLSLCKELDSCINKKKSATHEYYDLYKDVLIPILVVLEQVKIFRDNIYGNFHYKPFDSKYYLSTLSGDHKTKWWHYY